MINNKKFCHAENIIKTDFLNFRSELKGIKMIWKCGDKNIEYGKKTLIMAIINVTPDSFSDGGDSFNPENAIENAVKAQNAGADIIDFGAQSTRPGYTPISDDEEWERLEPVLKGISGK